MHAPLPTRVGPSSHKTIVTALDDQTMGIAPLAKQALVKAILMVTAVTILAAATLFLHQSMRAQHTTVFWRGYMRLQRESSSHTWRLDKQLCSKQPVSLSCAPGGWTPLPANIPFLEGDAACNRLAACNIQNVAFVGDSYMRHLMEAVTLVLTTDYEFGAMKEAGRTERCKGDGQFEEKVCRNHVRSNVTTCGGRLTLLLDYGGWPSVGDQHATYDAVFWGVGRHPIDGNYKTRHGINNASAVVEERIKPLCTETRKTWLTGSDIGRQRVFWINSHRRLHPGWQPDEADEVIATYNKRMEPAMRDLCGIPTIDLHTPSSRLVEQLPEVAPNMTHDGVHWSRAVNLVFAQQVLHTLLQHCQAA